MVAHLRSSDRFLFRRAVALYAILLLQSTMRLILRSRGSVDWDDLQRELDLWSESGRISTLWWRDDDVSEPNPSLVRLLDLAGAFGVNVSLAAVPLWTNGRLRREIENRPYTIVLQHGFEHRNHATSGQRAIECGGARPVGQILEELRQGQRRLELLLGSQFFPVLAPPWNRISDAALAGLTDLGYIGLSTFGTRLHREPVPGLILLNTHVEVLTWRNGARFAGCEKVLGELVHHLEARRARTTGEGEPLGLLTHHKDHDADVWPFIGQLLRATTSHVAARWVNPQQALAM